MDGLRKSLADLANALRGNEVSHWLPLLVLREAAEQLGRSPGISASLEEAWRKSLQDISYPHVQAAARGLLEGPRAAHLKALDSLVVKGGHLGFGANFVTHGPGVDVAEFWMDRAAAKNIAALASGADTVRCSFDLALHPALYVACAQSQPHVVRFISKNQTVCDLAKLCAAFLDVEIDVVQTGPLSRADAGEFECEIAMPPFGADLHDREVIPKATLDRIGASDSGRLHYEPVAISDVLTQAKAARAIIGVSSGALFRSVGVEAAAREELIASKRLSAMLSVPPLMISIRTALAAGILILQPQSNEQNEVRFVDLSHDRFALRGPQRRMAARLDVDWSAVLREEADEAYSRDVSLDEIREKGCVLTMERYVGGHATQALESFLNRESSSHQRNSTFPLAELVELIRPMALPKAEHGETVIYEAAPKDIGESGTLARPGKKTPIDRGAMRKARNQQILPGDVLLCAKGAVGTVGMVPHDAPDKNANFFWTAGQSLMILRPKGNRILPEVLYEYLSSDAMQEHLRSLAGGAAVQSLNIKDLRDLRIPVMIKLLQQQSKESLERRQRKFREIEDIRNEIEEMRLNDWPHRHIVYRKI